MVVRTVSQEPAKRDKNSKKALVGGVSALAALLFGGGLEMIGNPTLGCLLIGLGAVIGFKRVHAPLK